MNFVVIVLTYNEEKHIRRCLAGLQGFASSILVIDSFSTDNTVEIAKEMGAMVLQNSWVNHGTQFNWAIEQLPSDTQWVLRVDADEYLDEQLISEIRNCVETIDDEIEGITVNRQIVFSGKMIRYGGVLPIRVLRLFRYGKGRCENRWMDEHIIVDGEITHLKGNLVDYNLNPISWWIEKHNSYASREAVDLLNLKYNFMVMDSVAASSTKSQAATKRWIKEKIYSRLPKSARSFIYFIYRYIIRLGFLDGSAGAEFHFLQGFWYRNLVDIKIREVERAMKEKEIDIVAAIDDVLGIQVSR